MSSRAILILSSHSQHYVELLKTQNKITISVHHILAARTSPWDPLWGYYDVRAFFLDGREVETSFLFPGFHVMCGDFFCGQGFLTLKPKKERKERQERKTVFKM